MLLYDNIEQWLMPSPNGRRRLNACSTQSIRGLDYHRRASLRIADEEMWNTDIQHGTP